MTRIRRRNVKFAPGTLASGKGVSAMSAIGKQASLLIVAAFAVATARADAASTVFVQDFNTIDLDFTQYTPTGYTTSIGYSDGVGRAVSFTYDRNSAIVQPPRLQAISQSFLFDPTLQGPITSIDASIDMSTFLYVEGRPLALGSLTNRLRLLAKQDGKVFEAVYDAAGPAGSNGTYKTAAHDGFTASDFFLFDPANPYAARTLTGLDFTGSTIAFGFELTLPTAVYTATGAPYDGHSAAVSNVNAFAVKVNYKLPTSAVPEPNQWAVMIAGFGLAGTMLRRRRGARLSAASI